MKLLSYQRHNYAGAVRKTGIFLILLALGFLMGMMREMQAQAENSAVQTNYFAIAFFVIAGTSVPVVVSLLKRWIGNNISKKRNWEEKESQISCQIEDVSKEIIAVTQKRLRTEQQLEKIMEQFGEQYEKALANNRRKELLWKTFDAKLQSDMSLYSEAYRRIQSNSSALQLVPKLKYLAVPLIALMMLLFGCSRSFAADWFVLCDRSSSSSDVCNKDVLKDAISGWLKEASTGDKFEVFVIGGDVYDTGHIYSVTVPKFSAPVTRNKAQWKKTKAKEIDGIKLPDAGKSAMFQAIWRVSQKINKKNAALILISDLRHVDKRYNFEKKVPSGKEFIKYLGEQGIGQINLTGHRVYICGFHPNASANTSTPTANTLIQTKSLWEEVIKSWRIKVVIQEECHFEDF